MKFRKNCPLLTIRAVSMALLLPAALLLSAPSATAGNFTEEELEAACKGIERCARNRTHVQVQYQDFRQGVENGRGDLLAAALLRTAERYDGSDDPDKRACVDFALDWLDEFGDTNALPFLARRLERPGISNRHMTVASYVRIAAAKGATNEFERMVLHLTETGREGLRGELIGEMLGTVRMREGLREFHRSRGEPAPEWPGIRPACAFLERCYETEAAPGRMAELDAFVLERDPSWRTSPHRLEGARRMVRLHPDSEAARSLLSAVAAEPANETNGSPSVLKPPPPF